MSSSNEIGKQAAGKAAAELVQNGMVLGLGTGSTVLHFLKKLSQRCQAGLQIKAVASSENSARLAEQLSIPLIDINTIDQLDLTIDGADEIDSLFRMIKGGGGALTREKVIACMSKEMAVIVDASKCVNQLGMHFPLPVEIIPFGWPATIKHFQRKGITGQIRKKGDFVFITDNGNYIYDVKVQSQPLEELHALAKSIPGVVETGFFSEIANKLIIGYADGSIKIENNFPACPNPVESA